jgi:hypothetical protein
MRPLRSGGPSCAHAVAEAPPINKSKPTVVPIMHLFILAHPFFFDFGVPGNCRFVRHEITAEYG